MIHILDSPLPIATTAASSNRNFVGPRAFIFNDERRSTYQQDIVIPFIITFLFFFVTRFQNPYIDFSCHNRGCDHILTSQSQNSFGALWLPKNFWEVSHDLDRTLLAKCFIRRSVRPGLLGKAGSLDFAGPWAWRSIWP